MKVLAASVPVLVVDIGRMRVGMRCRLVEVPVAVATLWHH